MGDGIEQLLAQHPPALSVGGDRVERTDPALLAGDVDRVALVASWAAAARMSRSLAQLIGGLQDAGYRVVVCSTSDDPAPLSAADDAPVRMSELTVLRRPNVGYDFGTWSVLMSRYAPLLRADKVLVVNDSLIGPFAPLGRAIADFESTSADVWGLVESGQVIDHLQSFFRGFRYGCLAEPTMRDYWDDIRVIPDKGQLIRAYEYGFTPFLREHHYSSDYFVDFRGIVTRHHNPTIGGWRALLDAGVPFVKRELVRRPELVPDGGQIEDVVRAKYGVELRDWI